MYVLLLQSSDDKTMKIASYLIWAQNILQLQIPYWRNKAK